MSDQLSVDDLRDLLQRQAQRIEELEGRVKAAEKQVEEAEIYSRQDCLILRGRLDVRPNCSLRDEVTRIIHHHTGIHIQPWCLNTVHWLGRGDSIIIRFNNKAVRDAIYRNRVPKDVNKRGLFIHECLTTAKVQTVSKCTKLRREGKLATYYTQSGHVFVKRTKESPCLKLPDGLNEQEILDMVEKQPTSYRAAVMHTTKTNAPTATFASDGAEQGPKKVSDHVATETSTETAENTAQTEKETETRLGGTEQTVKKASQLEDSPNRQPEQMDKPKRADNHDPSGKATTSTNKNEQSEFSTSSPQESSSVIQKEPTKDKDKEGGNSESNETSSSKPSSKPEGGEKSQTDGQSDRSSESSPSPRRKSKRRRNQNKKKEKK